jgi:hypothetical protein
MQLIPNLVFDQQEYKRAEDEYDTLCGYKFVSYVDNVYGNSDMDVGYHSLGQQSKFKRDYATLKLSGYEEIAQRILDLLIDSPELALEYFFLFGTMITPSHHDSFYISYNPVYSIDGDLLGKLIKRIRKLSESVSIKGADNTNLLRRCVPSEIGSALVKKLALVPEGYHGCIFLMDKYKEQDLNRLLNSIQEGVNAENIDLLRANANALSIVLDNFWNEAKNISKYSGYISSAMPLTLGLVGPIASHEFGLLGGLLAGLGIKVLDKKIIPVSEKISKIRRPNHLVAIHDFMKKYSIKD